MGHKVVLAVCEDISGKGYHIYRNNFFTSVQLAADLLEHGTDIIETSHHNRVHFPKHIVHKDAVAGCIRGKSASTIIDNKIHCFVWLDNKPVIFIDILFRHHTPTTVPRGLNDGTRIQVSCLYAVRAYNENIGGLDLADQMRRFYTCTHKSSRRWYLRMFWFLVDLAIDNAFILECIVHESTPG